jgi:hypothetical protein
MRAAVRAGWAAVEHVLSFPRQMGPRTGGRVRPFLLFLLLAAAAGGLSTFPLPANGQRSGDHPAHLANAVETERLLARGQVVGWSDFKYAGHLANGYYPPLAALLVAGVHRVGRPLLDWDAAYDACLLAVLCLGGALVFAFLRGLAGTAAALVGTVVAFWLDPGALWVGGRFFVLELGVWPFALSAFLVAGALAILPAVLARPTLPRLAALAVLVALAVLAHPFAVVMLGLLGPTRAALVPAPLRTRPGILASLVSGAFGFLLAAWWLLPFAARAGGVERWPADGIHGHEALHLLATGAVFRGAPAGLLPWALLGTVAGLRTSRRSGVLWAALAAGTIWFLTLEPLWPGRLVGLLENAQWVRLQIAGRWLFFGLAGLGAVMLARGLARAASWRTVLAGTGLVACTVAMVLGDRQPRMHLRACWPEADDAVLRDIGRSLAQGSGRVALYSADTNHHCLLRLVPWAGRPYIKLGFTPADTVEDKFWTLDPTILARIGVTAVVSDGGWPAALAALPLVQRQGRFSVRGISPLPRAESLTPGADAQVVSADEERLLLRVSGPPGPVRVRLYVTSDVGWEATQGDRPLPLLDEHLGEGRLLTFRAEPGPVELHHRRSLADRVAPWISWAAFLVLGSALTLEALRRAWRPMRRGADAGVAGPEIAP